MDARDALSEAGLPFKALHAFYVTGEDFLRISALGIGTQVVRVTGRMLDMSGEHKPFAFDLAAPASRTVPATIVASIGCGWIENVTAIALTAGTGLAQTYVTVDLVRGASGAGGVMATLVAGYVSSLVRLTWPGSPLASPLSGPGVLRTISGTNPAAGVEISETVPAGARWRFVSLRALLTSSAVAANRNVSLAFDDGANIYAAAAVNFNQAASLGFTYHFGAVGQTFTQTSAQCMVSTPANLILLAGHRVRTITSAIDVGDDWGAPVYQVEEWLEGA